MFCGSGSSLNTKALKAHAFKGYLDDDPDRPGRPVYCWQPERVELLEILREEERQKRLAVFLAKQAGDAS